MLAMAHSMGVKLSIDDFTRIGKKVPVMADLRPSGKYMMSELIEVGGILPLMKMLLKKEHTTTACLQVCLMAFLQSMQMVRL
jgi:dihydroxy-acid dehydratase